MEYIVFLHYFLANLFYLEILPVTILLKKNGHEYYGCVYHDANQNKGIWVAMYSKLIKRETNIEILIEVKSRYRYILFFFFFFALWKIRDNIKITIDNY